MPADEKSAREFLKSLGYTGFYVWSDPPGTFYDWHSHRFDEVRFVLSGSVTIKTKTDTYELKAGDFLEIRAGTLHLARTSQGVTYLCAHKESV